MGLLVSQEFYKEWHEHEYVELLQKGYKKSAEYMMKNIQKYRVLICTISHCLTSSVESFVSGATTVVFDEASQVDRIVALVFLTGSKLTRPTTGVGLSCPCASNGDQVTEEAVSVR